MKKILHMVPPIINNGVYRYIFNHMRYIDQRKYEFSFLTKNPEGLSRTREFEQFGFPIRSLCNVERNNPNGLRDEITGILRGGYDAIHLHTSYWRGFLIEETAMELGVPKVIVHSHSTGIDVPDGEERGGLLKKHEMYKKKFSLEYATDVCACSKLAGEWLYGEQIPREKIQILPNAVDIERFRFDPRIRRRVRGRLGIDDRTVVGNVGRYCYQKNQGFLLEAFARAHRENRKLFLLMLGEGELFNELRDLAEKLEIAQDVCFMSWQEYPEEYLQAMDIFCLPSRFEGLPISIIEAQASGLRCLVSDSVTRESDITGLVEFIPLDRELWADQMKDVEPDVYRAETDECFHRTGYSMERSCEKLIRLYESA